jgi:D-arginine dehydrogenase
VTRFDIAIIGSGMAGASAAYEIAAGRKVLLLEREAQHGYHTTGRSAALFTETYGNDVIRALTAGGRRFLTEPPTGFSETPLMSPRGVLLIGRTDQMPQLAEEEARARGLAPGIRRVDADEARRLVPVLRADYVAGAVHEPHAMDIDVHALHHGFLRGARARGAEILNRAEVVALEPTAGGWCVISSAGNYEADIVVNAAGAWADRVGALAGAAPIGLQPKRRTAIVFQPPPGAAIAHWPAVVDIEETFYFKPDAGRILASPADETPMEPCDVQAEELDIAIAVDRVQRAADLPVRRVERSWAGLRSFVADKTLVAGFDPLVPGFFWLAGQGGYGIQTSPAMGRLAAALLAGQAVPEDLAVLGVTPAALAPARCQN